MRISFLCCIVLACQFAHSQSAVAPHPIDEETARKNFLHHSDPIYPPIAKAARVQGTVDIAVTINTEGKVTWEKVVIGPPMLQQAALSAVREWTFKPYRLNGTAVPVSTVFEIPFQIDKRGEGPTKEQEAAAQAWFPVSDKCRSALHGENAIDSVSFCKQALELATRAGATNSSDQIGLMLSHQYYGHALLLAGRPDEALSEENIAIEETKKWRKDTDQEYAMPFFWRAIVEARLRQVEPCFSDLQIAEETHRKAIEHLPEMKKMYSASLASILKIHAGFLEQLGRTEEAAKLRAEAATL